MKILLLITLLSYSLFGFEGQIMKFLSKTFTKSTITKVSQRYGNQGLKSLEILTKKYGQNSILKLNDITTNYGTKGLKYLNQYGEIAIKNRTSFSMIDNYGSKGAYLLKKYPNRSINYYNKYGDKFIVNANKYGNKRVISYLDESKKFNQDSKVLKFLDKFGDKANIFLDRHWGKLLASGFVLLNADSLIASTENITTKAIDKSGDIVTESISNISNSQLGLFIGIAILLFVFTKYGLDALLKLRKLKKENN